ncbi:YdiU family protein [Bacillus sp. FJAT-49711]|uniref:protein adenylyltransferase SelO n=1 Tax=Bacillus sp. FJAT-49711 TaxID=2833585 RepID=UPI001BCA292E|nr:YdiU family protein [Bacillus sp. FJAT-49711]MBS4218476.1 YdiU family protein [Bacillus sp. FJAT-49711]
MAKQEAGWNLENSYVRMPSSFFTDTNPTPVNSPKLIILNQLLTTALGFNIEALQSDGGVAVLAGNKIPEGAVPIAQAYAGHQFGNFTMLGDGRAVLLGEQITPRGDKVDIQLKGSGRTRYSRGGDGRAALGPMLREYIMSEAMHALRIPTTRGLAVVATGEMIIRETELPGAILTRVAASHLRVGTFEYAAQWGTVEDLKKLADYAIERHYPSIEANENRYLAFLEAVIKRQSELIAKWMLVGFIHGVMNTDNMTISGETIDYGPCAFMDTYDPAIVFSSIDIQGRYAYGNQPYIGAWNLSRFAETLLPLLDENQEKAIEKAQEKISNFSTLYHSYWLSGMRSKLGFFSSEKEDEALINDLLDIMKKQHADYTNTFLALTFDTKGMCESPEFIKWKNRWQARLERQPETKDSSIELMKKSNPAIIPRNHHMEESLEAVVERSDYSVMERFLTVLSNPYEHSPKQAEYALVPDSKTPYRTYCGT